MARRASDRRRSYAWLIASLLLTTTAIVPLAWVTLPAVYRWRMLDRLDSADLDKRERALRWVASRAPLDPAAMQGVIGQLHRLEGEPFFQLVQTLHLAGLWERPTIPDGPWLAWLEPMTREPTAVARIIAAQRLADLGDLATDPRVVSLVERLLGDADADVRINALAAAAELAGAARYLGQDAASLDALVVAATRDPEPRIRRDAFLFVGLLDPSSGVSANWLSAEPEVAAAIVWAASRTNPDQPLPDEALALIAGRIDLTEAPEPLRRLAALEEAAVGEAVVEIDPQMPDMLRLAAVAVTADPRPQDLRPLFFAAEPSMRDLAAIVAADRFTPTQNEALAGELLRDFDDHARMGGAILAGLTGVRPTATPIDLTTGRPGETVDLLAYRLGHAREWRLRQVLRLALWMQERESEVLDDEGKPMDVARLARILLSMPQDVPLTSVLLAMLHRRDPAALDFIFNPRGQEQIDLIELFDQQRWWRVMRRYLPRDAPPFDGWARPDVARLQVEALRNWYLVHRFRLRTQRAQADEREP